MSESWGGGGGWPKTISGYMYNVDFLTHCDMTIFLHELLRNTLYLYFVPF